MALPHAFFMGGFNLKSRFRYNDQFWSLIRAAKELAGAENSSLAQRQPFATLARAPKTR
jgi:hypothetical protein